MNIYQNKLLIIANTKEKRYHFGIKDGIKQLKANGFECYLLSEDYKALYQKDNQEPFKISDVDYICSLGGDGTFLYAGSLAIKYGKILFGINYGHVGYLCAFEKEDIEEVSPKLLSKKKVIKEPLLECVINKKKYYAINDVVVGKNNFGVTISLKASCDGNEVCNFKGDGLIVATKLGSSAYNSSCGSPVLKQNNEFIITAVCPYNSLFKYKIIYCDSITEVSLNNKNNKASIYCDGKNVGSLTKTFIIRKAQKEIEIIK